jgi:4-oxalocrotonate tautomerase
MGGSGPLKKLIGPSAIKGKWRFGLPTVIIELLEGRTEAQKAELAKAITDAMVRILGVPPNAVTIIYHDLPRQNIASAGTLFSQR